MSTSVVPSLTWTLIIAQNCVLDYMHGNLYINSAYKCELIKAQRKNQIVEGMEVRFKYSGSIASGSAQVTVEHRCRPIRGKRQEGEQELKSGYFFLKTFLVHQRKSSTEQLWTCILHFSPCFSVCWLHRTQFCFLLLPRVIKAWTFNLALTLDTCFEVWK